MNLHVKPNNFLEKKLYQIELQQTLNKLEKYEKTEEEEFSLSDGVWNLDKLKLANSWSKKINDTIEELYNIAEKHYCEK